ncbi:MAG: hypothetical protein KDI49_09040 [Gammaproteobacteria bacterium]|nr:hypothetical protein [Gammaproteobacteria bacterium]
MAFMFRILGIPQTFILADLAVMQLKGLVAQPEQGPYMVTNSCGPL